MRTYKAFVLVIIFGCLAGYARAQKITGKVVDQSNQLPVTGASVIAGDNQQGTSTNEKGEFSLDLQGAASFKVSSVGYETKTIPATDALTYNVLLTPVTGNLDQVVVVGYGTQKKANLTGAVATVDVERTFQSKPLNDPTKALQGIVPGLTIQYGNGGLTAGADIKIRGIGSLNGTNRPLILVDNVPVDDLSIVNPQDIESISVLKDAASASIYGARAAFGVVLIKTKSGHKNQAPVVTYTNNFSWNKPTVLPDFANPVPELQGLIEAADRAGNSNPELFGMYLKRLQEGIANWQENYSGNTGTEMVLGEDWEIDPSNNKAYFYKVWDPKKEMLKDYTSSQQHNISIQGGGDKVDYYLAMGYSNDGGIYKLNPDKVEKYNITAGVNASVTDWLDVRVRTLYRNYKYDYPHEYQNYWYYFWRWGAFFPYGTYQGNYFRTPMAYLDGASRSDVTDNYQRVDLGATLKITPELSIRADYTIGRDNALRHDASGPIMAWDFWGSFALNNIGGSTDGVTYTSGRLMVNTFNAYATYDKTLAEDHHLKAMAGVNAEEDENINFYATRQGLFDPSQAELGLAYGDATVGGTGSGVPSGWSQAGHGKRAFAGYFARINYDYKGKYLLELNGRYDGSSYFPPQDRWAFFPSASAGYRISEEDFMAPLKPVLSDLKIRASYGELGNQDISTDGSNAYLRTMNGQQANWIGSGGLPVQTISQPRAVANSLKWERVSTLDFGADMRFLNNHIGLTVDWYERNTNGMTQSSSVPSSFGTSGPLINAGNFRTRGYEINIDANYSINKDLQLYATLGFSDAKTVFTKWDNPNNSISTAYNYVGKTYGEIWGFETDRYFTADDFNTDGSVKTGVADQTDLQNGNFEYGAGDVKYKDVNGDGVIDGGSMTLSDHGDLKVIGNTQPRYQYNARIGGNWKNFDVDVFIQGVGQRDYWGIGNIALPMYQGYDILYANQLDYWTPEHTSAYYPRPYANNQSGTIAGLRNGGNNFYPQTKYMLNLAYLRLKNVSIGYTLPATLTKQYHIQKLRIYASGQNLAEISNVGAPLDPEITDGYASFIGRTFPFMRSFSFGAQLTF